MWLKDRAHARKQGILNEVVWRGGNDDDLCSPASMVLATAGPTFLPIFDHETLDMSTIIFALWIDIFIESKLSAKLVSFILKLMVLQMNGNSMNKWKKKKCNIDKTI